MEVDVDVVVVVVMVLVVVVAVVLVEIFFVVVDVVEVFPELPACEAVARATDVRIICLL